MSIVNKIIILTITLVVTICVLITHNRQRLFWYGTTQNIGLDVQMVQYKFDDSKPSLFST